MLIDEYRTIKGAGQGFYSELRSKFLAFAYPVENADEAMHIISGMKREYHDARHVAYAYMIGADCNVFRCNDDGEPSGTAGRPILGQIRSSGLTNVLVAVVRYFGGVKLGTSRLAEAYRAAAAGALSNCEIVERYVTVKFSFRFSYEQMNNVKRILRNSESKIIENTYDEGCKITVEVRQSKVEDLQASLEKVETLFIDK